MTTDRNNTSTFRRVIAGLLLFLGVQLWLVAGHGMWGLGVSRWIVLGTSVAAWIPPVRRIIAKALNAIRQPSPLARRITTVAIAIVATAYLVAVAHQQELDLVPRIHDESSYLIQTRMAMHGRLWMPQHPLADFFESFHILTKPVYASKYFPGLALLFAPGLALGLHYWMPPAIAGGVVVALVYRVVGELTDYAGGALAALMMLAIGSFRRAALLYIATMPVLLLVLLAMWSFLHWRRATTVRSAALWSVAIGVFSAWAGLTRPLDAICFAIPIGIGMLINVARAREPSDSVAGHLRTKLSSIAYVLLGALPFLVLQLIVNHGITGSFLTTPWASYTRVNDPYDGMAVGRLDVTKQPQTTLPQKREFAIGYTKAASLERRAPGRLKRWANEDLQAYLNVMLPQPLLMVLLPVGVLALGAKSGARCVLYATMPAVLLAYSLYSFAVPHYLVVAAPATALGVILGIEALAQTWPRLRNFFWSWLAPTIVGLCLTQLPHFNRFLMDDFFRPPEPKQVADMIAHLDHKPAIVLFHYAPGVNNPHVEPVYNTDVAWPDDAPVIRAHDLGPRNVEIFRYYAARQPDRFFYRFDRADNSLKPLGYARDLAKQAQ